MKEGDGGGQKYIMLATPRYRPQGNYRLFHKLVRSFDDKFIKNCRFPACVYSSKNFVPSSSLQEHSSYTAGVAYLLLELRF